MPTNNLLEEFNKFEDDREFHLHNVDKKDYLDFIETQISLAREEGRQERYTEVRAGSDRYSELRMLNDCLIKLEKLESLELVEETKPTYTAYTREMPNGRTYVMTNEPGRPFMTPIEEWNKLNEKQDKEFANQDKPMDKGVEEKIELLPTWKKIWEDDITDIQLDLLTTAVNSLIKKHNR